MEKFGANIWLLSPPCQPYTQGGKRRDDKDSRSAGLLHLIKMLELMPNPPLALFLENVPFFETSNCHAALVATLQKQQYVIEQYMVAPTDPAVGIPNRRKRFYLAAYRIQATNPLPPFNNSIFTCFSDLNIGDNPSPRPLSSYIIEEDQIDPAYLVPLDFIKSAKDFKFDIIDPWDQSCATFTKAYGSKYVIGTGSFIRTKNAAVKFEPDDQAILVTLGLRFFSPREIADLHAFPVHHSASSIGFRFPPGYSIIQQYRLLGNSLNVRVVSLLLQRLFNRINNCK